MDLKQIASSIPDYPVFLTIDEMYASTRQLANEFPGLVRVKTVGQTRRGDPIELISIGDGPKSAFLFAGPHPNEPIGCMTVEYLTRKLCEDAALRKELGFTWHFIKCINSDGMRLNEGWMKGPFTPLNYARHFFRPAAFDQVEWTFPVEYKKLKFDRPMPETKALMQVIDEVKPDFIYSLHNAGFGGVYYYVSGDCHPLYKTFHALPGWFDLALDLGEPEVPYAKTFAPAVFEMLGIGPMYDYLESNGMPDPSAAIQAGTSSADYASKYKSFFLVVEMPYFDEPRVNDQRLTDQVRRDLILKNLDMQDEYDSWVTQEMAKVQSDLRLETLFSRAVKAFLEAGAAQREAHRQWAKTSEETNRPASQAEVFSNLYGSPFYRLLMLGMFARMLEAEIADGNSSAAVREVKDRARARLEEKGMELERELNYRAIPIRSLVGVQVCAGLATVEFVRDRQR